MPKSLQVGIIGVSADGGWARESHVPAVQKLSGLELAAVASKDQAKSNAAARVFGVKLAYGNARDLILDPNIDLVAVCVRGPDHREVVLAALEAGKHVYCEWPLGRNTAEAEEMAAAADAAGFHAVVGLQTRTNTAMLRAREVIVSGAIGRPLSSHVYSSTIGFGSVVPTMDVYLEKPENGVNLITIQGAHTIDLAIAVLGGLVTLAALATIQYPEIRIGEDATRQARLTFDHLLVQARLAVGAALSVEVAGGRPPETPFRMEVVGEKGILALEGGAPRGFQSGRLLLSLRGVAQHVDEGENGSMPDAASNVASMYATLRDDIQRGTSTAPDFHHAVRLSRLLDDLLSSSRTGVRKSATDWPV
jgi:predicted dehydrogenase